MLYKPNFCCNCGEKIERANWSVITSRRFCDVCQEDFRLQDWSPKIFALLMSIIGIFGFGTLLLSGEKPANDVSKQLSARNSSQTGLSVNRPTVANEYEFTTNAQILIQPAANSQIDAITDRI